MIFSKPHFLNYYWLIWKLNTDKKHYAMTGVLIKSFPQNKSGKCINQNQQIQKLSLMRHESRYYIISRDIRVDVRWISGPKIYFLGCFFIFHLFAFESNII